jgi:hypothetical protein
MDKFQAFGKNIRCVLADERNFERVQGKISREA